MFRSFFYFLQRLYRSIVPLNTRLAWRARRRRVLLTLSSTGNNYIPAAEKYHPEEGGDFITTWITHVTWTIKKDHPFLKGELYTPVTQQTINAHVFDISGWVLEQDHPLTAIEVRWGDEVLFETKLDTERTEVIHIYPAAPDSHHGGFRVAVNVLMLAEEFELQIYATLNNGAKENIGSVSGRRSPLMHHYKPELQPLTVIGLPRSGTTLLMNYLSNHPSVTSYKAYPYEFLALSYWLHFFRVLGAPADLAHSTHPNTYLADPYFIGHHPFFPQEFAAPIAPWFHQEYASNLLTFCLHSIESCYQEFARIQNKTSAAYFAEKLHRPTPTYHLQWSLYPQSHSVLIVRDFRDQYCSAFAFHAKDSRENRLPNSPETDLAIIKQTRRDFMLCYHIWKRNPERVHVVRYEDLVLQPHETLAKLFDQLGLGLEAALLDKILADTARDTEGYTQHRTAKSNAESIERWRTELNAEQQALFQAHLGDLLSEFGYEV